MLNPAKVLPYEIFPNEHFTTLKISGAPDNQLTKAFDEAIKEVLLLKKPLIVNCEHLSELSSAWMRSLIAVIKAQKENNLEVRLILVSKNLQSTFKAEGVAGIFRYSSNLREARIEMGLMNRNALDVDFINPFLAATIKVLKIQAQTDAIPGKLVLKADKTHLSGDISGVIGITSESFSGALLICFPEKTFLGIMSRMLGETITNMNQDIIDGAGELTNIILGQAKVILNEKGYGIKTALPSIVVGKDHKVQNLSEGPVVSLPFQTDIGDFSIEICLS